MRLVDANAVIDVFEMMSEKGPKESIVIWKQCIDIVNSIEPADAVLVTWIQNYIWGADTHEEKRALRKMYIQWEKENEQL